MSLFWLIVFGFALFAIFVWPSYLDNHGKVASGSISEKQEGVRVHFGEWYRRLEIVAAYSVPGQPLEHRAICDVDEKTYDSLHVGNQIAVHYFALPPQPFLPTAHLAPCTTVTSLGLNSPVPRRFALAIAPLLVILFFWRVLRLKIFMWLLFPWIAFAFICIGLPRVEPEPQHPVSATAMVDRIVTIKTLGDEPTRRAIPLRQPYQIVLLKFLPPGMDTPVTAVDKVDEGSVPNLKEKEKVDIVYDAQHPRVARLEQGTRRFPGQAMMTVVLFSAVCIALIAIAAGIGNMFRAAGRKVSEAAQRNIGLGSPGAK